MSKSLKYWVHPLLFGIFSLVVLYAYNINEIPISSSYRAFVFCLIGAIVVTLLFKAILGNWQMGALAATFTLVLFFSYGHIYNALKTFTIFNWSLGRHRILVPLWLFLYVCGFILIKRIKNIELTTTALNIMAVSALILPTLQIITFQINDLIQRSKPTQVSENGLSLPQDQAPPDIYYIIPDSYARDDYLLDSYGYDNSSFLSSLEETGFYVGNCSRSNYAYTNLSLASSLNMNYIDALVSLETLENEAGLPGGLKKFIVSGLVQQNLESLGYTTIAFETGFRWTEITDADIYLSSSEGTLGGQQLAKGLTEFEVLFLKSTAALFIIDLSELFPQWFPANIDNQWEYRRQQVLFTLDQLETIPSIKGPKFVFAHIASPHRPYIFEADGSPVVEDKGAHVAYVNQVAYMSSRIETLVHTLIEKSDTPPIIIIQGDHAEVGPTKGDKMKILNAYYLPLEGNENLYSNISPVNTFRLIFNTYFGGDYPLLEDVSYYSSFGKPYTFEVVPETRSVCLPP